MTEKMEEQIAQSMYNQIEEEVEIEEVEESEEEVFTLDFEKGVALQKEETLIIGENVVSDVINSDTVKPAPVETKPAKPTFDSQLSELFIQSLTSKAVSSLIEKLHQTETDMYKALQKNGDKMGKLGMMLEDDMFKQIDSRRKELRAAYGFGGCRVYYDKIPDWARTYVENYVLRFVRTTCELMEDVE